MSLTHLWRKYSTTFSISWAAGFVYRLNFIMWRVRTVIQTLTIYFLWSAVLKNTTNAFGYTAGSLLTYIIATSIVRAVVFSSRSTELGSDISSGDLNNFLTKPVNIFGYWLSRDAADKILNILFSVIEITLIFIILKPPLQLPPSIASFFIAFIAVCLAAMLYFFFSLIISTSVFWMPEGSGWPQRFLVFVVLEFLAGGLFPLDILPKPLFSIVSRLPTAYMLHTPIQLYLGRIPMTQFPTIIFITCFWIIVLYLIALQLFKRGVRVYGAYGR